ncbi:MAG: hypothetical protein ACLP1D_04185 [Xanthobacteraceae bacterium]
MSADEIESMMAALTKVVERLSSGPTKQSILKELLQLRAFAQAVRASTALF